MKKLFLEIKTGVLIIINSMNPDSIDYEFYPDKYKELFEGNRKEITSYLENYFEENNIPEEERIFSNIN